MWLRVPPEGPGLASAATSAPKRPLLHLRTPHLPGPKKGDVRSHTFVLQLWHSGTPGSIPHRTRRSRQAEHGRSLDPEARLVLEVLGPASLSTTISDTPPECPMVCGGPSLVARGGRRRQRRWPLTTDGQNVLRGDKIEYVRDEKARKIQEEASVGPVGLHI